MKNITIKIYDVTETRLKSNKAIISDNLKEAISVTLIKSFYTLSHHLDIDNELVELQKQLFKVIDAATIQD